MNKHEVVNAIIRRFGLSTYLEIASGTTGRAFDKVTGPGLRKDRLLYAETSADGYVDTAPARWRSANLDCDELFADAIRHTAGYDIVFVDPYHNYFHSHRDIAWALKLAVPGGFVVVHDCDPPSAEMADPEYRTGAWCGRTFAAFLQLVHHTNDVRWFTVDSDYGVGVIHRLPGRSWKGRLVDSAWDLLDRMSVWRPLTPHVPDFSGMGWHEFMEGKRRWLRLVSPDQLDNALAECMEKRRLAPQRGGVRWAGAHAVPG